MNSNYQSAIKAALSAANEIMDVYSKSDFGAVSKEDGSPVTIADQRAHDAIVEVLNNLDYPILSEEGKEMNYDERKDWKSFWMVDPLDGTKEFIHRRGEFTVNIALIDNHSPVFGVVVIPVKKELYFAFGDSCYYTSYTSSQSFDEIISNAKQIEPSNEESMLIKVAASRSHLNQETSDFISGLESNGKKVEKIQAGSSLKFCLLAKGEIDIYPRFSPCMEWDTAAAHAILLAVGKNIIDQKTGKEMVYNKENLLNNSFIAQ